MSWLSHVSQRVDVLFLINHSGRRQGQCQDQDHGQEEDNVQDLDISGHSPHLPDISGDFPEQFLHISRSCARSLPEFSWKCFGNLLAYFWAPGGLGGLKLDEIEAANPFLTRMARNGFKLPVKTS